MAGCGGDHGSTKDGSHVTVRLHNSSPFQLNAMVRMFFQTLYKLK